MNYPIFTEEELDELNMSLFEASETGINTPRDFYSNVYDILTKANIKISEPDNMLLPPTEYEQCNVVAMRGQDYIHLYLSYGLSPDGEVFASHAELVDNEVLGSILMFTTLNSAANLDDAGKDI